MITVGIGWVLLASATSGFSGYMIYLLSQKAYRLEEFAMYMYMHVNVVGPDTHIPIKVSDVDASGAVSLTPPLTLHDRRSLSDTRHLTFRHPGPLPSHPVSSPSPRRKPPEASLGARAGGSGEGRRGTIGGSLALISRTACIGEEGEGGLLTCGKSFKLIIQCSLIK